MIITDNALSRLHSETKVNGISLGDKVRFVHNNHKIHGVLYGIHLSTKTTYDVAVKLENHGFYSVIQGVTDIMPLSLPNTQAEILNHLTEIINALFVNQNYVSDDIAIHDLDIDSLDFVEILVKLEQDLDIDIDHSKLNITDSIAVTAEKIFLMVSNK